MEWSKSVHIVPASKSSATSEGDSSAPLLERINPVEDKTSTDATTAALLDESNTRKTLKKLELEVDEMMIQFEGINSGKL
jgi:hypothetical protein